MKTSAEVACVLTVRSRTDDLQACDQLYFHGVSEAKVRTALVDALAPWNVPALESLEHDPRRIHEVLLSPRLAAAKESLIVGRWYPAEAFAGIPDGVGLVRLLALSNGETARVDCNHPLATATVEAEVERVAPLPYVPGRPEPPLSRKLHDWLNKGVGLQAYGMPDWFDAPHARMRDDVSDDAVFYAQPRLVQHIDPLARATIARWYAETLTDGAEVLDLMSSWVTHLPAVRSDLLVDGLGMNADELARNPMLRQYFVHDLNRTPQLPVAPSSYDAAVCSVSVEYLQDPVAVFKAVAQVLKPGGTFTNAFSNRCFPTKAIALWSQLRPFEQMAFVAHLYARAGTFGPCTMRSFAGAPRPPEDDYANQMADADPVYLVAASRAN